MSSADEEGSAADDARDPDSDGRYQNPDGREPSAAGREPTEAPHRPDTDGREPTDGLVVQMFSVHGLIRGRDLELGHDADTGGQTKYVVELTRALGQAPGVARVDLFTRWLDDPNLADDYAVPVERLGERSRIVRIKAGGARYRRKELLWPVLDEFVEGVLAFDRENDLRPDVVHGHYADGGYVALRLASLLGAPLVFTGHSLGRNKLEALKREGMDEDDIDRQYHIHDRIDVEEEVIRKADLVIASTNHELEQGYELYQDDVERHAKVIPPGIDVDTFYPYFYDLDEAIDPGPAIVGARVRMRQEIARFLNEPQKPLILALSRPDRRKNIDGLVRAYGEDKELQQIANLAIFAGVRKDITSMDDNEREVLTQLLLLMDRFDLYGRMALPKKHDPDTDVPVLYRIVAAGRGVFINPALIENFGITLLEAGASGLPVVSTRHGGPQEIIDTCHSGILIDARDTGQIQGALKHILVNREAWESYSENGVAGVREHYAWSAHAATYLDAVRELRRRIPDSQPSGWRSAAGARLRPGHRLLVSDIDGTLVAERAADPDADAALARLAEALRDARIGFALASGRSLESTLEVLEQHPFPKPEALICAVGSEIYYGSEAVPDRGYARYISHGWRLERVRQVLEGVTFLRPQPDDAQRPFKLSFFLKEGAPEDPGAALRDRLQAAGASATVIVSRATFVDVLPRRASKGRAIRYLVRKWGLDPADIVVAGDSGNDEGMLRAGYAAIVIGDADELQHLRGRRGLYFSQAALADGVAEGLRHHGLMLETSGA